MKRLFVLVPLALVAALAWWVWRDRDEGGRGARREPRMTTHPGETLREVSAREWEAGGGESPELETPSVLLGTVYDFNGRPVYKAEVSVLHPQPSWMRFTGNEGVYELKFSRPGTYLVEARLHLDLAPQRALVEIPEEGDPPRQDFHLKAAGYVFGEVVVGEATPVWKGFVDIDTIDIFGDAEYELDTDIDNGFFSFAWEPPRDVPLRVVVRTDDGFMKEPVRFKYEGKKVDLGRIKLTRFPRIRVRMRLPDGKWADDVWAYPADAWMAFRTGLDPRAKAPEPVGWNSQIRVPTREGGTVRLVLEAAEYDYRLLRDVDLVVDQFYEFEVNVRPGPIAVRGRLRDEHGDPVRARFRLGDGETEVETGPEGWFNATLPHGGLFDARLSALLAAGSGWIPTAASPDVEFVLDADAASADCTLRLDRRVLVLARGVTAVRLSGKRGSEWECMVEDDGDRACLSPPLPAGTYRWEKGGMYAFGSAGTSLWRYPQGGPAIPVTVREDGWTVIDAR